MESLFRQIMDIRCVVWWDSSPTRKTWKPPIFGRAPNGCERLSSCRATGADFGNRRGTTTAPMSGARNDSVNRHRQHDLLHCAGTSQIPQPGTAVPGSWDSAGEQIELLSDH